MTDGRFSGGTRGLMIGHVAPEAAVGGPIAVIRDGDRISIDLDNRLLLVQLDKDALAERLGSWTPPTARYCTGVMAKYRDSVSSAAIGAVTVPRIGPPDRHAGPTSAT
ncbi:MAG TPA: dihydroxy-acid dehydratase [Pseudonocardiaceae bacterium]|nr:dihydroxy-acid dehydratase [Pseudonocardiaceae bacterium]